MSHSAIAIAPELPRPSARPLKFSPAAQTALGALALFTPGLFVDYEVDEGGNAYAILSRRKGQFVSLVIAAQDGKTIIRDHRGAPLATLDDDEAGIRWTLCCEMDAGDGPWAD